MKNIRTTEVPKLFPQTHTDQVGSHLLVFQPLSTKGLAVLNPEAAFFYKLVDGKRRLYEIFEIAKKEDPSFDLDSLKAIFAGFSREQVIYLDRPRAKRLSFPTKWEHLGVWFHLTNNCNLRCPYCYVYKSSEKMEWKTAKLAVEKIISSAKKNGFKAVTFKLAGGEPLLELDLLFGVVRFAKREAEKAGLKVKFVVLTNGVLLTKEVVRKLKKEGIKGAVSLDGLGRFHDETRYFENGRGSFQMVEEGIQNLQKAGVLFNVSVTISKRNVANLPDLTAYLLARKIPFVFNFYRENVQVKEALEEDDERLISFLKKAYSLIEKDLPGYNLLDNLLDRVNLKKPHLTACGVGRNYVVVDHKGGLGLCQTIMGEKIGVIGVDDPVGAVKKRGFPGLTVEEKNECALCRWRYACGGGCPLLTFDQKGSYSPASPYCAVYKALIPEVLRLEAKRIIEQSESEPERPKKV